MLDLRRLGYMSDIAKLASGASTEASHCSLNCLFASALPIFLFPFYLFRISPLDFNTGQPLNEQWSSFLSPLQKNVMFPFLSLS